MNLEEFARRIADNHKEYSIQKAKHAIITVMTELKNALVEGEEEYRFREFGCFVKQIRPGRRVYSKILHSEVDIPTRVTIRFKPSEKFKELLNHDI